MHETQREFCVGGGCDIICCEWWRCCWWRGQTNRKESWLRYLDSTRGLLDLSRDR